MRQVVMLLMKLFYRCHRVAVVDVKNIFQNHDNYFQIWISAIHICLFFWSMKIIWNIISSKKLCILLAHGGSRKAMNLKEMSLLFSCILVFKSLRRLGVLKHTHSLGQSLRDIVSLRSACVVLQEFHLKTKSFSLLSSISGQACQMIRVSSFALLNLEASDSIIHCLTFQVDC